MSEYIPHLTDHKQCKVSTWDNKKKMYRYRTVPTRLSKLGRRIVVWKKAKYEVTIDRYRQRRECLVKLEVTTMKRRQPVNHKCRAASAKVLAIHPMDRYSYEVHLDKKLRVAYSAHDPKFKYRVGKRVEPKHPFHVGNDECVSGIHFFLTMEEAMEYYI